GSACSTSSGGCPTPAARERSTCTSPSCAASSATRKRSTPSAEPGTSFSRREPRLPPARFTGETAGFPREPPSPTSYAPGWPVGAAAAHVGHRGEIFEACRGGRLSSLRVRLFAAIGLIVALSVAVTLVLGVVLTRRAVQEATLKDLAHQAALI